MTKKEIERQRHLYNSLESNGIAYSDIEKLRRISLALHSWFEKECGTDRGHIERDEETNNPYWVNAYTDKKYRVSDRETGAMKRLAAIMGKYPHLTPYVQPDPRGAALYVLRPQDMIPDAKIETYYSRGIGIY